MFGVGLQDHLVAVQGNRDVVRVRRKVGEREQEIALRLENNSALLQELIEGVAAHDALRNRRTHQVTASGLVADLEREVVGRDLSILSRRNITASAQNSHQLKPGIGLHDEGRGRGGACSDGRGDDVDEREGIGVVHK